MSKYTEETTQTRTGDDQEGDKLSMISKFGQVCGLVDKMG